MKEGKCFSCREVSHRTMDCPSERKLTSQQRPIDERKPTNKLAVSRMAVQESERKESRTVALHAKRPRAEEPQAEKTLIVSLSTLPGNFFAEEALVTSCKLGNNSEIKTTALLDTGATGYLFVDPTMARRVCDKLHIEPVRLSKPKALRGFDGKQAPSVTHTIYPTITIQDHKETTTPMLITKLGQHQIILGKPWIKKHDAVLDIRNDRLTFWPGHYQHDVALKPHAKKPHEELNVEAPHIKKPCAKPRAKLSHAEEEHTEKPHAEEPHANRPMKILKQTSDGLPEPLLPYLLHSTQDVSKVASTSKAVKPEKKKKKKSTISQKPNTKDEAEGKDETKVEDKKPSVKQVSENDKPLDLAMIGEAPFMHLARSKKQKAEIFAISMRDIEYQLNKETKPVTDPRTVVPEEYHDLLDVFSKDISDTLRLYGKYDHKIELLKDKELSNLGHSALRGMSTPQLEFVKKFLEEHLKKGFIEASSAPCSSLILLAKKPGGGIRFCVDYQKLNSLTKKDAYPLLLIAETIVRLKKAIVFTKIDIH